MFNPILKTFTFGNDEITLETGHVARQADGAVMVTVGKTKVLCTVVGDRSEKAGQDFFPLSVHYQEKAYASGRIPGAYGKREGRPSENETLISRLIDRPIRPLFPKGFMNEVQVICTVISSQKGTEADIASLIGTSAALCISGIPFNGPIGAAKVGFDPATGYMLNPNLAALATSKLEMVVAGTKDAVLMVESEAQELNEDIMLGAVLFAHDAMQVVISAIKEFAAEVAKPVWEWSAPEKDQALIAQVTAQFGDKIGEAYRIIDKSERSSTLSTLKAAAVAALVDSATDKPTSKDVLSVFGSLEKSIVRNRVVAGEPRIDGRDNKTVRSIASDIGVLPAVHGSALFTRGETQAIVAVTLGSAKDSLYVDSLNGTQKDYFMLHYNFPSYSVGECGRMGSVGRREIGHGRLAKRGVLASMPSFEEFPYTVRVVSEITESNGSSSMASVCGTSLALMDAGVPVKTPVAGIAMGLVKEEAGFAVLTDILGDEDHLGDMDFKVAGSRNGITALQMDIKIEGITEEIMEIALEQAHTAVHHILDEMAKVISVPRSELSANAPSTKKIKIDAEKIRDLIGKGGATIRSICEDTTAQIDISDNGEVTIFGDNAEVLDAAIARVLAVTAEAEVGKTYKGVVKRIVDFGAFIEILPGKDGLVHISQISQERVENVADVLSEGQEVSVKVLDVDNRGRVKLSMKEADTAVAAQ